VVGVSSHRIHVRSMGSTTHTYQSSHIPLEKIF
jgi:hypothetical protein